MLQLQDISNFRPYIYVVIFSVERSPGQSGASEIRAQELVAVSSSDTEASSSTDINHICPKINNLTSVESSSTSTSAPLLMHDENTSISTRDPLQNSSTLVATNNTGQGGISIFRRYYLSSQSECNFF